MRKPRGIVTKALIFKSSTEGWVVADQSGNGIGGWPTWNLPLTWQARVQTIIERPWYLQHPSRRRV